MGGKVLGNLTRGLCFVTCLEWLRVYPVCNYDATVLPWVNEKLLIAEADGIPSAVLADQVKSLDWKVRNAKRKGTVAADVMVHVRAKIKALLIIP